MSDSLFELHEEKLRGALSAIRDRTYWSGYPEMPSGKIYGETAKEDGLAAFRARLNHPFELNQPGTIGMIGAEVSPYGAPLGVTYPQADLNVLLPAAEQAMRGFGAANIEARVGVCLEILDRLNKRSFEIAQAVMQTTGQGFMMAFQAGGPHAQDRGLEAVAYAYDEMKRCPARVTWEKRVSKTDVVKLEKRYRILPRGVGVVVGCSTFPTWNSYPGLLASLATGNAAVVKPHPGAILPLAITVEIAREVLRDHGLDANVVTLAADTPDAPIAKELLTRPEVRIVDYTGGSAFGSWIEDNAGQAVVFTEKAGVNCVVVDSADDLKAMTGNLAFSVCLYSGQMCTAPQNIFIPKAGIRVGGTPVPFDEVAKALVGGIDWLLGDAKRATEVLGAIQSEATVKRISQAAADGGEIVRASARIPHDRFPEARIHSPLVLKVSADDKRLYMREMFGPIVYLVATESTDQSMELAAEAAREHGAITSSIYSTDPAVIAAAEESLTAAGAAVSCNLTGQIFVNQAAAFSDFHVSGANPAGNATLCDGAFVARRFCVVQSRIQTPSA